MENILIRNFEHSDLKGMLAVFNYFAENSFAVYCEFPLAENQFNKLAEQIRIGLVIEDRTDNRIIGFGYISNYKIFPNFNHSGILTYFILPEYTGKGLGTELFNELILRGRAMGITNFFAHISSLNTQSLNFHKKHGFEEAGIHKNPGNKFGEKFDIAWMQKQFNNTDGHK